MATYLPQQEKKKNVRISFRHLPRATVYCQLSNTSTDGFLLKYWSCPILRAVLPRACIPTPRSRVRACVHTYVLAYVCVFARLRLRWAPELHRYPQPPRRGSTPDTCCCFSRPGTAGDLGLLPLPPPDREETGLKGHPLSKPVP